MNSSKISTLAFIVTAFPPEVSGSAHFNWARVQWFAKQGMYRVIVFAPDGQNQELDSQLVEADLDSKLMIERYPSKPWIPYKLTRVPKFLSAHQISKKLAEYRPDLIIMTDVERFFLLSAWRIPGVSYAKNHAIPYMAEYHTDVYNFSATYPGWQWLRSIIRNLRLTSYLYHQLDRTICPSVAASKSCEEMGIRNAHIVRFFGTDISTYNPTRRDRRCLEPWLSDREKDNQVFIFLGRLGFEKRVDLLIEAFARLQSRKPNISLLIVGDGPDNVVSQLKRLAQQVENIHFTGFMLGEMKANLLASCDAFCSPSPYETFGLTVVEAMASGIPIVTVNSGGVSDYIVDGVNGYLVPPDDVEALANCLEQVLVSNNTAIIQRALQDANQFSVEQGCQNLHDYYQEVLSLKPSTKPSEKRYFQPYST